MRIVEIVLSLSPPRDSMTMGIKQTLVERQAWSCELSFLRVTTAERSFVNKDLLERGYDMGV